VWRGKSEVCAVTLMPLPEIREMDPNANSKKIVATRIPHSLVNEIGRIAERDSESQSTVIRRLLRQAIDAERRSALQGVSR
jgi:hypothetical protein